MYARLAIRLAGLPLLLWWAVAAAQGSGGINAPGQVDKPYLVLISIDGFRWDYPARYDMPALSRIIAEGVKAEAMIPVFPTLTFPNHFSIATGLYPARHGLVGNRFPSVDRQKLYSLSDRSSVEDGSWYSGEPIWVAAERAGMVSAAFFFVGTEAPVDGIQPSHWHSYDESISGARRVDQAIEWLSMPAQQRPHLVTLYFEDVDDASHDNGVDSVDNRRAAERVDRYLSRLLDGLEALPFADEITLMIVSDHGQAPYRSNAEHFVISDVVDLTGVQSVDHGPVSFLYFDEPDSVRAEEMVARINDRWARGQAITRIDAPPRWHLNNAARVADVIVQADPGAAVAASRDWMPTLSKGDHGWAPEFKDMHGIFIARGPRLPQGRNTGPIVAVDVYPLMLEILELPQRGSIDGDPSRLVPLLDQ
jgi:predicted AlkP superfamily pyrophosphatase or phosphodiesterase